MAAIGGCLLILVVIAVFAAIWAIWRYNNLIALRNQVVNGWKQIDVQLKRRHDLIPNLIAAVRGEMQFEQDTLEKVIQARNSAVAARPAGLTASRASGPRSGAALMTGPGWRAARRAAADGSAPGSR